MMFVTCLVAINYWRCSSAHKNERAQFMPISRVHLLVQPGSDNRLNTLFLDCKSGVFFPQPHNLVEMGDKSDSGTQTGLNRSGA